MASGGRSRLTRSPAGPLEAPLHPPSLCPLVCQGPAGCTRGWPEAHWGVTEAMCEQCRVLAGSGRCWLNGVHGPGPPGLGWPESPDPASMAPTVRLRTRGEGDSGAQVLLRMALVPGSVLWKTGLRQALTGGHRRGRGTRTVPTEASVAAALRHSPPEAVGGAPGVGWGVAAVASVVVGEGLGPWGLKEPSRWDMLQAWALARWLLRDAPASLDSIGNPRGPGARPPALRARWRELGQRAHPHRAAPPQGPCPMSAWPCSLWPGDVPLQEGLLNFTGSSVPPTSCRPHVASGSVPEALPEG